MTGPLRCAIQCAITATLAAVLGCHDETDDCGTVEDRAVLLVRAAQTCDSNDECTLITLNAGCIEAFVCSVPVSESADLDQLRSDARDLSSMSRECSLPCPVVNCAPPDLARVRCIEHRCSITGDPADGGP